MLYSYKDPTRFASDQLSKGSFIKKKPGKKKDFLLRKSTHFCCLKN